MFGPLKYILDLRFNSKLGFKLCCLKHIFEIPFFFFAKWNLTLTSLSSMIRLLCELFSVNSLKVSIPCLSLCLSSFS